MQTHLARLDAFYAITTLSVEGTQTAPFTLETIKPKLQKYGEETTKWIEARSKEILVEPYRMLSALMTAKIVDLLNHPEKLKEKACMAGQIGKASE